ncbi:MAG: ATP-binding cassette domain-containing protein [Gorillibacterium sp.]|nr:ATP-binding cassette domain-containing protein [Gorillibacterium sp.]
MLELKGISKSYTTGDFTQVALNGINLDFRKNEFVAILGQSGSGKTTCLNVIGGLDQYDKGDLIINGKSTKDFKDADWDAYRNNSVGFIFQSYNLISHLSIVDNVELGMTLSGISVAEKHKKAIETLERVGLKEHIHKKPNQLSGGQMQRVAIARALANDPDIILADEPTGALDTETSVQIMNLIKEIAEDKLVIMVTHNPELAHQYADRIVEFRDGQVTSDSNPYKGGQTYSNYNLKKTSMNFLTALKLSGTNIKTKKWRTTLTAFASSIGIIGIALILSLSNGFDKQISAFESGTLSSFPIMITQNSSEMNAMSGPRNQNNGTTEDQTEYPAVKEIYPHDSSKDTLQHTNVFTDKYIQYIEAIDPNLLSGISYTRMVNMNMLKSDGQTATTVNTASIHLSAYPTNLDKDATPYLETSYDLLAGAYPSKMNDLVLIVDNSNQVDVTILEALGMDYKAKSIKFDDILGHEFKVILNDDFYEKAGELFALKGTPSNLIDMYNNKNAVPLNIVGIIRANPDNELSVIQPGIAYSDDLSKFFIENAQSSAIVKAQQESEYNVLTGEGFSSTTGPTQNRMAIGSASGPAAVTKDSILSSLGASGTPYMITVYPKDFTQKETVLTYLDTWNKDLKTEDKVVYTDLAGTFSSMSGGIMDAITLVLVAFASISLVVSLIMMAIITYVSVLERTKEIGVLRALGARKKDITRVFNAETFIIGVCSGILGILIAWLLTIPVNMILKSLTDLDNVAQLNPLHAALLVVISVALTMLGGFIPAKMAAKKDPVTALRSE